MVQYTAEQKAKYFAENPDKLKAKLEREAKKGKAKPKPKARQPYAVSRPRVSREISSLLAHKYMSPFDKGVIPPYNNHSMGNFTCVNTLGRLTVTTSTQDPIIVIFAPSIRGVHQVGQWNGNNGNWVSNTELSSPTHKFGSADTPISFRPLRAGVKIRNITSNHDLAGIVRILKQSSAIEFEWQTASTHSLLYNVSQELVSSTQTNPKSKECTGVELSHAKEYVVSPATMANYNEYGGPFASATALTAVSAQMGQLIQDMAMENVIICFEPTSVAQTYSLTFGEQMALRYPTNTLLSELSTSHRKHNDAQHMDKLHSAMLREPIALDI